MRSPEARGWKYAAEFVTSALVGGLFVVVPVYLAVLLLLKGMKSVATLVKPVVALLPAWIPAERLLSLLLVLFFCFLVGAAVRTPKGRAVRERLEKVFFARLPGYDLVRSLTQRLAGDDEETAWTPALVEIEEALVPAFVIEELDDGRLHHLRAVGADTVRRRRVRPQPRPRAHRRRPLHPGHQVGLALGLGVERPGGRDAIRPPT